MVRVKNSSRGKFFAAARRALFVTALGVMCAAAAAAQGGTAHSVTDSATPSGIAPGAPAGSFPLSGFENVNLFNGRVNFALPLLSLGGRGEAGYTVTLKVERNWRSVTRRTYALPGNYSSYQDTYYAEPNEWNPISPGWGPGVLLGRQSRDKDPDAAPYSGQAVQCYTLTRLSFIMPDGTENTLRDTYTDGRAHQAYGTEVFSRGTVFAAKDGSSATFVSDQPISDIACGDTSMDIMLGFRRLRPSGHLMLKNGVRYRIVNGLVQWIRDRNGNKVTFAYSGDTLLSATDAVGRTVTFGGGGITYKGFGGADRVISITTAPLKSALRYDIPVKDYTYYDLFPQLNGSSSSGGFGMSVVTEVVLPDGRKYKLSYNEYAELARVELPTGGAVEYDHDGGLGYPYPSSGVINNQIYRRVVKRRVYPDGGRYAAYATQTVYGKVGVITEVTSDAAGNKLSDVEHAFNGSADSFLYSTQRWYEPGTTGREAKAEVFSTAGSRTLLRRVEYSYTDYPHPTPGGITNLSTEARPQDTYLSETKTTLADTNQVTRQKFVNDQYGNEIDSWEYDYGAGAAPPYALRHTHTDYVTDAPYVNADVNPAAGAGLRGLARAQRVYAVNPSTGVETLVAQGETLYDETSRPLLTCGATQNPIPCSSAPQWDDLGATVRGNATTARKWLDTANVWLETHAQYDGVGNVRLSWDGRQNVSEVSYLDAFCNGGAGCGGGYAANTFAFPTATKSPKPDPTGGYGSAAELTSSTIYDYYTGLAYSATDANNRTAGFEYDDPLDRPTAQVRPDGSRTDIEYSRPDESLIYVRTLSDLDGTRRLKSEQHFDNLGRPYRSFSWEGQDASKPWMTTDILYDAPGRAWRVSNPYRSAGPGSAVDAQRPGAETTFDSLGRVTEVKTTVDGAKLTTDYRGTRVLVTDQNGGQRISVSDALGRLTEMWEVTPNDAVKYPGVESVPSAVTSGLTGAAYGYGTNYFYDTLGNLRRVKQGGQERFFAYDSLGRLIRAKNPEQGAFAATGDFPALTDTTSGASNGQWSLGYTYDSNGNLKKRIDARGVVAAYTYDGLNRNTLVSYSDGTPGIIRVYDSAENGLGRYRADWTWDGNGTYYMHRVVDHYDVMGRPLDQRQHVYVNNAPGTAFTSTRTYDRAGNVLTQSYPSGHAVSYGYDAAGRLGDDGSQPAFAGNLGDGSPRTYASEVVYAETGGMSQERFGTQTPVYNKRLYNSRGQLAEIRVSTYGLFSAGHETDWNRGAVINHYSTTPGAWGASGGGPDNGGNLQKQEVYIPHDDQISGYTNVVQEYGYDHLNRLNAVYDKPGNGATDFYQLYKYDRWGNRTIDPGSWNAPAPQYAVDPATNRLGVPAGYAAQMNYDAAGNLVNDNYSPMSYGDAAGQQTRFFDAEGRMTSARTNSTQTAVYKYDADGRRVKRSTGSDEVWQFYGMGGELLAEYAPNASPAQPQKEYGYRGGELLVTATAGGGIATQGVNVAAAANGATATGSTSYDPYGLHALNAINGSRTYAGSYWNDQTAATLPDSLQINFAGSKSIAEVDVYFLQDDYATAAPTAGMTFTQMGVTAFDVQYWNGAGWVNVPGGGVAGNNRVWRKFTFTPVTTDKIRVVVNAASDWWSRIVEVEAYEGTATAAVRWQVADQLGTPRVVLDQTGSLAQLSRQDYFPFGEEIGFGVGGRGAEQGYPMGGQTRQRFTGYERDGETDLDYANARFYASRQGRFVSPDPLLSSGKPSVPQSWNRYTYCLNNPLNLTDPSGLDWGVARYKRHGQWVDEYRWFGGKVGKYRGKDFKPVSFGKGGHLDVTDINGNVNRLRNDANIPLERFNAPDMRILEEGAGFRNAAIGGFHGGFPFGKQIMDGLGVHADEDSSEYLASKKANFAFSTALSAASLGTAIKGASAAANAADDVAGGTNRIYSARVLLRSADDVGPNHNFPMTFDSNIFSQGTRTVTRNFFKVDRQALSNDAVMYRLPGTINGHKGTYEIGVRLSNSGRTEVITHRFFNPR